MKQNRTLFLELFKHLISVRCDHVTACTLIESVYSWTLSPALLAPALEYLISYSPSTGLYSIARHNSDTIETPSKSDFIYYFEKDFTIELQKIVGDEFFFIHGAALERNNQVVVISGQSGAGKSTTTWALLHHGFHYLSDELTPIIPGSMEVLPFPHSICLKSTPPIPYALPESTLTLERTWHIPILKHQIHSLPNSALTTFIFLEYRQELKRTTLRKLEASESMVYIYQNALNQLAHPNDGLPAALQLANETDAYLLRFSNLDEAIRIFKSLTEVK